METISPASLTGHGASVKSSYIKIEQLEQTSDNPAEKEQRNNIKGKSIVIYNQFDILQHNVECEKDNDMGVQTATTSGPNRSSHLYILHDLCVFLFDINDDSVPDPDGFSSGFFKVAWTVVGEDFCQAVLEFFNNGHLLKQLNATFITLIPKLQLPVKVADFRPISCCNVVYKCIMKIMVKRMQLLLEKVIDNTQNTFVPGRSISDNILLAQEILSGYNQKHLPSRCTIKLDLQKAYDMMICFCSAEQIFIRLQYYMKFYKNSESCQVYKLMHKGARSFFRRLQSSRNNRSLISWVFQEEHSLFAI
ncbi:UNVERIFIED_CONTAM: hypothetical protein Slati_3917200 [Sesamum latifolium]|uniref:Reverse transcriptase domain-containing protein n=1 Tax=Sesamum latifolium TaxID=2727402 RepID=A0AAW2TM67_9LAMI